MPDEYRDRLRTQVGLLPQVDFNAEQTFGAILASRIVHFLDGETKCAWPLARCSAG